MFRRWKVSPVFGCHFNARSSDDIVIYVLKTFAGEVKVGGRESVHVLLVSPARQSLSHWLGRISLKAIVPKSRECFLLLFSPVSSFLSHASLNAFRAFREKKGKSSKVLLLIFSVGSLRRNGGNTLSYSKETFSLCCCHCWRVILITKRCGTASFKLKLLNERWSKLTEAKLSATFHSSTERVAN